MDYDTLKSINDNIKRFNGKLILENEALNKQIEALTQELALSEKKFDSLNLKMQDLMLKGDSLFDKKEALKKENKELQKSNNYLKSIIETLQKEKTIPEARKDSAELRELSEPDSSKKAVLRNRLKEISGGKYLNPVYNRISDMMGLFFENQAVDCNSIKDRFGISRATFARDTKILKDMGYIELTNSKKEGLYNLTKSGKKLRKEIKKEVKKV